MTRTIGIALIALLVASCGGAPPPARPTTAPASVERSSPERPNRTNAAPDRTLRLAGTPEAPIGSPERVAFFADLLEGIDRDWRQVGFVLEELVRIELARTRYPADDFHVATSLQYFGGGRTLGELDVVVVRLSDGRAVEVGQVKFSGNPRRAVRDAEEQIDRFRRAVDEGRVERLKWSGSDETPPAVSAFGPWTEHVTYGCLGSVAAGFDFEVDIDRDEGDAVQTALLARRGV